MGHRYFSCEWTLKSKFIGRYTLKKDIYVNIRYEKFSFHISIVHLLLSIWKRTASCLKHYGSFKGSSTCCVGYVPSDLKRTESTVHNTALNSSMGIDITTYWIRIGRFGPGRGCMSTGISKIYSSSTTGSDIHYRMLATMVLLTFLLKCCVMIQQEGIMQDVYTFAGTDQCQCQCLAHTAIYEEPFVLSQYTYFQIATIN